MRATALDSFLVLSNTEGIELRLYPKGGRFSVVIEDSAPHGVPKEHFSSPDAWSFGSIDFSIAKK